jgi:cytochrome c-type biogenesis protein CcmH/NrfG
MANRPRGKNRPFCSSGEKRYYVWVDRRYAQHTKSAGDAKVAIDERSVDEIIARLEKEVSQHPKDTGTRLQLALSYMKKGAGRCLTRA